MTERTALLMTAAFLVSQVGPLAAPGLTMRWEVKLAGVGSMPCLYPSAQKPNSIVVTAQPGFVIRLDAHGKEVFRFDLGGLPSAVPAIGDLDGDGSAEIVAGTREGIIVALSGEGKVLWRHRLGAVFDDFKCVVLSDVTGDGKPEVLLADNDGWVNCLDHAGHLRWRFKIDPYRASPPAVGDLDGDGSPEVVYGTDNGRVVCISADGRLRWQFRQERNFGRSLPMIADLGSGPVVLINNSSPPFGSHVYCIEGATGRLKWAGRVNQQGYAAVAVGDIDGDGRPEVITADKSNTVFAFDADGTPLWATHVGGHGIFFSPAVADVDGDGQIEILTGVRQTRQDGRNLFLLTPSGQVKGEYSLGSCQNTAPAVADLDNDGILEVVTCSPVSGAVYCFTFGGRDRKGAVQSACFRGASGLAGSRLVARLVRPSRARPTPFGPLVASLKVKRVGTNDLAISLPQHLPQAPLVEVSRVWQKTRETRVFDLSETRQVSVALMPGQQRLDVALVDGTNGRRLLTEGSIVNVSSPAQSAKSKTLDIADMRAVIEQADASRERARLRAAFNRFKAATRAAGWRGSFAAWQDSNPWDNVQPIAELPVAAGPPPAVEVWALGNEHEHAALNIVALENRPVTLRAKVEGLDGHVEMLRPVWLPTKWGGPSTGSGPPRAMSRGGRVPDLLPGFKSGVVFDVVPGEPCQLWLHFSTQGLEPGVHQATLTLTSLEDQPSTLPVKIMLDVSPLALPDQPSTRVCVWRGVSPDGSGGFDDRVWDDLREHGVTVVYAPAAPAQKCNEKGELGDEPDWKTFDDSARRLGDGGAFLFVSGFSFQGPANGWSPEWVRAMQETARRLDAHLHSMGIGNDRWAYYPVDEPCLTGEESVDRFLRYARIIREAAPNIWIYANPAGAVSTDFLQRMSPYCDVWCPELSIVKTGPREWIEIMRGSGRPIWSYEAPGDVRALKPLGFYRMQPWVAARHGIDGSGYWVYSQSDLWGVGAEEPGYGAMQIEADKSLVTTRRWEATRDGIEDATLLHMLSDAMAAAEKKGVDVSAARKLRQEALDAIAARQDRVDAFTRFITDYDMDFESVQRYRRQIAEAIISLRP